VIGLSVEHPAWGAGAYIRPLGKPSTVRNIWLKEGLERRYKRILCLELAPSRGLAILSAGCGGHIGLLCIWKALYLETFGDGGGCALRQVLPFYESHGLKSDIFGIQ